MIGRFVIKDTERASVEASQKIKFVFLLSICINTLTIFKHNIN